MKITVNQLRRIIKEEVSRVVETRSASPKLDLLDQVYRAFSLSGEYNPNVPGGYAAMLQSDPSFPKKDEVAVAVLKKYGKTPDGYVAFVKALSKKLLLDPDEQETAEEVADEIWSPKYQRLIY